MRQTRATPKHPARLLGGAGVLALSGVLSACGVAQSEDCQHYLACQAHYDESFNREPPNTNLFQPDGVCWESDDLADECSAACRTRTQNLVERLNEEAVDLGDCG